MDIVIINIFQNAFQKDVNHCCSHCSLLTPVLFYLCVSVISVLAHSNNTDFQKYSNIHIHK